jgi:hypothetical protein
VKLDVVDPDFPVTNADGLKPYITSLPANTGLRQPALDQLPATTANNPSESADSGARASGRQTAGETLYQVLQVDPSADGDVIEAAFRRLALRYHPDTSPDPEASLRMREIIEARECLTDVNCRRSYDRSISRTGKAPKRRAQASPMSADSGLQAADRQRIVELLTQGGSFEAPQAAPTRRPVKRRAA